MKMSLTYSLLLLSFILLSHTFLVKGQVCLSADGGTSGLSTYELIRSILGPDSTSQVPDCKHNVTHIWQDWDDQVNRTVFHFAAHILEDDDDCCCGNEDRQRTEITPDPIQNHPLTALYGETLWHSWDFRLDSNFQVSYLFTHISQIKAVGGNDSMPIVTTQLIKMEDDKDFLTIIHMDGKALNSTTNSTTLASVELDEFRGEWIHAEQEAKFGWEGSYSIKMTRRRDGKVLVNVVEPDIEMWRYDHEDDVVLLTKPKWGIYRSKNYKENLRDEIVKFDNFCMGKR